ncbi:hypothetical protein B5G43_10820 [Flavonifractor sp. An92]|uniref:ABC transporter permease n=1 Tax=Flavonifractor sp. An92 TaxID=1965666 RepID=UPI000B3A6D4C|nr:MULTISPECIES: ABC transporter permease [unclassified Flavonifractor]OUN05911.1 hypothetical protein B5G43_10820 [Flavonifractor sp. An92]OUQ25000.1 hypothetical protein B5E80_06025 [Flavonifractor sp. An135]
MQTALREAVALLLSGDRQLGIILATTLRMVLASSLLALVLGGPLGVLLGGYSGRWKGVLVVLNRTLMGLPPVVVGLICYMLFSGVGPLRHLRLLYTVRGMVIAQVVLLTPLIAGSLESHVSSVAPDIRETALGLGLSRGRTLLLLLGESQYQLLSAYLLGLGRAFAEVGAVSMVGGAIAYKTNVMTTAIMNYTNMGSFTTALALGIILLGVSLVLNAGVALLHGRLKR